MKVYIRDDLGVPYKKEREKKKYEENRREIEEREIEKTYKK